jgi:ribokinase
MARPAFLFSKGGLGPPAASGFLQAAPIGHYTPHGVSPPVVVVVGDVMVDVVVRQAGPFNRGSDTTSRIVVAPGGSATNQAVAFAGAGADVHLVAVVGDDELGRAAARALAATGVQTHLEVLRGEPTGVVVALVDASGERSMFTDRGANLSLAKNTLLTELFGPGTHLHLSGYELLDEATRGAALEALEAAAAAGMTRSVDPSSAGPLASVGAGSFLGWTQGLDWCCANLEEGRVLTGQRRPEDVVAGLRRHYREVALTLGADGAMFSGAGAEFLRWPADRVAVEDTTGAGDAFTGTFLARRLWGDAPEEALRAGLAAAARVVSAAGARSWS